MQMLDYDHKPKGYFLSQYVKVVLNRLIRITFKLESFTNRHSLTPNLGVQDERELGQLFDRRQTYPIGAYQERVHSPMVAHHLRPIQRPRVLQV